MGLLDKLKGQKSEDLQKDAINDFLNDDDDEGTSSIFSINTKIVTREQAERLAVVNMGVNLIAEAIAEMPIYLYKRDKSGGREKVDDYRNRLLNMDNGSYSNAYNMKKNLITDYLYHGNGYLDIQRDASFKVKTLIHIPFRDISPLKSTDINKRNASHKFQYWGMEVYPHDVVNLVRNPKYDEITGYGLLGEGRLTLASLMAIEEFMNGNAESGFNAKAVIEKDTVMSKLSIATLRQNISKFFGGANANKNGGVLILDDGMKLKQLNQSSKELELLNQKELLIKDVARHLKLPLPLIGIATSGMTYSNEQQLKLTLLKQTLMPIIRNLEETLNKYLLTEKEKDNGFFFEFQYQDILKVSPQEEMSVYGKAVADRLMSVNEARQRMNLKPKEGHDDIPSQNSSTQTIENQDGTLKGGDEENASGNPQ